MLQRLAAVVLCLTSLPLLAAEHNDPMVPSVRKPRVEMVFAIDTTGSMGGLIEGAKKKVWYIANEVQKAKQRPEVRVGLVAYRDRGDAYVTQVLPLTTDLDKVYETLMGYAADGGGDGPEDVNAALSSALGQQPWTDGKDTLKMIFLVGDAPPHMDYDQVQWNKTVQSAVRKNIYVNTIQCGSDGETTKVWKDIALAAEGRFARIAQDGGEALAVATPFDAEIGRLSSELDGTYMTYGEERSRKATLEVRARASGMAASAAPSVAADRAAFKAEAAPQADEDLVDLLNTRGKDALKTVSADKLPEPMRAMAPAEQEAAVRKNAEKRASLQKQIGELQKKREAHLTSAAKAKPKKSISFDDVMVEAVHVQGEAAGLSYE